MNFLTKHETRALSSAVFAKDGGAVTTYSTTQTLEYQILGKVYRKTAVTNGTTPTTDINTGAAFVKLVGGNSVANVPGQGTVFVWMINAAGTIAVAQGLVSPGVPQAWPLDMQGNFAQPWGRPNFPHIPEGYCPFAYQVIKAGATAATSWIFGTNNWNATGLTVTDVNVGVMPERPQAS
jgi:hypothetical protein